MELRRYLESIREDRESDEQNIQEVEFVLKKRRVAHQMELERIREGRWLFPEKRSELSHGSRILIDQNEDGAETERENRERRKKTLPLLEDECF